MLFPSQVPTAILLSALLLLGSSCCHGFSVGSNYRSPAVFSSSFTSQNSVGAAYRSSIRIRDGNSQLKMMFDQLAGAISSVVQEFGPRQRITEEGIKPALRQVRRALLDADVNIDVADALIDGVRKRSLGDVVVKGVTADQQFIKAMYDELVDMMGGDAEATAQTMSSFDMASNSAPASTLAVGSAGNPAVVLLAGLQGAGKERDSVKSSCTSF